ncbi:MAG: DNA primase [Inhella sp.]
MIPPEFVQQLLSRLDVAEVVGAHVELKKAGANLKGLCPFHGEKTPSFNVSPSRQTYHCFGCGAHGDALRFVMEYQGLGFIDGVRELARRVGMEVPSDPRSAVEREQAALAKAQRKSLSELLAQAAAFYAKELRSEAKAVRYLKDRGLSGRIAAEFGLGYAPGGWRSLSRCFPEYGLEDLETAGLVIAQGGDEGSPEKRYDRFRDRIMFPIRNVLGEVIGFGGRVIDGGEPKYLNSPETPVFVKGQELYGLFEGRAAIRQSGYALVVEGYMDVVALAQHGLRHAVATLGTACTSDHVAKLFRFTERIVFSFDGDAAGRRAAARALQAVLPLINERRSASFLFLPPEHDPDSYVRAHGAPAFERAVEEAKPLSSYLLDVASEGCRLDTPEGRARLLAQARPLWSSMPDGLLKRQLIGELARAARLPEAELLAGWEQARDAAARGIEAAPAGSRQPAWQGKGLRKPKVSIPLHSALTPEDRLLRLLLVHAAWWEQLSAEAHQRLLSRATPHARLLTWLDRVVAEQGPLHWAALRALLAADAEAMDALQATQRVDFESLDLQATLEEPQGNLLLLLEQLDRPNLSENLGRPAIGQRD